MKSTDFSRLIDLSSLAGGAISVDFCACCAAFFKSSGFGSSTNPLLVRIPSLPSGSTTIPPMGTWSGATSSALMPLRQTANFGFEPFTAGTVTGGIEICLGLDFPLSENTFCNEVGWGGGQSTDEGTGRSCFRKEAEESSTSGPPPLVFRRQDVFQRFFTAFSDLPGRSLAIFVQLFPQRCCASLKILSSSVVHLPFFRLGSRWLNQRSRHCFPMRPGTCSAILDHLVIPCFMQETMIASSSAVQGPFTRPGCSTFCHRCRHCISVLLPPRYSEAIRFQSVGPISFTAFLNLVSSDVVHREPKPKLLDFSEPSPLFSLEWTKALRIFSWIKEMPGSSD
mmetsp:Transcript_33954/g.43629  ORF Transcript_33954/g.43629 Transcript_33954/m.43629 type:complete len:338 (-) Transcript_33954:552-1565(-)